MGVVLGWRCMLPLDCAACGLVLEGRYTTALPQAEWHQWHLRDPCSPVARCGGFVPNVARQLGYAPEHEPPKHEAAPTEGCTCGFYIFYKPNATEGGVLSPVTSWAIGCWLYVVGLGKAVLHTHGARLERYRVLVAFPPADGKHPWGERFYQKLMASLAPLKERFPFADDDWRMVDLPGGYFEDAAADRLVSDLMGGVPWREALARWRNG